MEIPVNARTARNIIIKQYHSLKDFSDVVFKSESYVKETLITHYRVGKHVPGLSIYKSFVTITQNTHDGIYETSIFEYLTDRTIDLEKLV